MSNLVSTIVFLAVVGGLAWVGWGLEPHWSSKDGRKFMCRMLEHSTGVDNSTRARWHDIKVGVNEDELFVYARSRRSASLRGVWKISGVTDDEKKRRRLYEVRASDGAAAVLRVPLRSRCVPVLDALVP
jgi:hypothetical protein